MTHLAATIPPVPQAPHAPGQNNRRAGYLQRRLSQLEKPVYCRLDKNFLENLDEGFHYSVIGDEAVTCPAVANLIASP